MRHFANFLQLSCSWRNARNRTDYVDTHDIAKVVLNQRSILDLYRLDIAKYATENEK